MKFEDLLMEPSDEQKKKRHLEEEVLNLEKELQGEEAVKKALNWALHGPLGASPPFLSSLPPQVQVIIEELIVVEGEISKLDGKVEELKLSLYKEREQNKEWEVQQQQWHLYQQNLLLSGPQNGGSFLDGQQSRSRSQNFDEPRKEISVTERRFSSSAASDIQSLSSTTSREEKDEKWRRKMRRDRNRNRIQIQKEIMIEKPNELSEELLKLLISIYLDLNQVPLEEEQTQSQPSNRCMAKSSFACKSPHHALSFNYNTSNLDPYNISSELEGSFRDIGPYNNFIQITRASLDLARFSELLPAIRKLRDLMQKLSNVDLTFLTYKQKLSFWINIFNACVMHAFLQHGLHSTHDKLLGLMNKAELNVGGIVLNALAIKHFILRCPSESKQAMNEKEVRLRHVYGLRYPEPNVTFALCHGSWSSPALRVYRPEEVVNELVKAKVEYLEASIGVTSRKKIVLPSLLQWHMRDFADDIESLLEWIYSQLPRSSSLKSLIMDSLSNHLKSPTSNILQVQSYQSQFRYLLPI